MPDTTPRILVVDDELGICQSCVKILSKEGHHVEYALNGYDALKMMQQNPFDLIITDLKMSSMGGMEVLRRVKESYPDSMVIVITGYGTIENAVECMRAGALDYLIKPFSVDQIQVSVNRAVEHRELRRRAIELEVYRELSYIDPLTGIYNRRFFDEILETEIQKSVREDAPLVLVMIDIDDFKSYNDCNGHQQGDAALERIARLFKTACRSYDIVARYGGEEFAIIFPGARKEHALELGKRIVTEVGETHFEGEHLVPSGSLTVSAGVACFPEHANDAQELIRHADEALYEAKNLGKNTILMWKPLKT